MRKQYVIMSAVTILALGACAKHEEGHSQASPSSSAQNAAAPSSLASRPQGSPATGSPANKPAQTNLFTRAKGNPDLIPVASSLEKPIPTSWYDLQLINLYMIHKAGLDSKISHNDLIKFFDPKKYGVAKSNVFDRKPIVQAAVAKANSVLTQVPTNQPFYLNTDFTFNPKYNFKGQYFPMQPFDKTSSFSISENISSSRDSEIMPYIMNAGVSINPDESVPSEIWPTNDVTIRFTNYSCIKNIKMPAGKAQLFLNKRTDSSGDVNNTVFSKIDFIITGYEHFGGASGYGAEVYARLLKATVYNSSEDAANGGKPIAVYNCQ
jgi:hypothetical protein